MERNTPVSMKDSQLTVQIKANTKPQSEEAACRVQRQGRVKTQIWQRLQECPAALKTPELRVASINTNARRLEQPMSVAQAFFALEGPNSPNAKERCFSAFFVMSFKKMRFSHPRNPCGSNVQSKAPLAL